MLDYAVRVSSREAYVSPTRGAQGNALKTLLAMGFALDGEEPVETIIEAGGTAHRIVFCVDQVRQEPRIDHRTAPSKGVNPNLLSAQCFGETRPVAPNDTPEGKAKNRRVNITLTGDGT